MDAASGAVFREPDALATSAVSESSALHALEPCAMPNAGVRSSTSLDSLWRRGNSMEHGDGGGDDDDDEIEGASFAEHWDEKRGHKQQDGRHFEVDDSPPVCWICRSTTSTPDNLLITKVCICRGTIGWVHRRCIDDWVLTQHRTKCPNCTAVYKITSISAKNLPQTRFEKLVFLTRNLFFPLLSKTMRLVLGFLLSFFVLPILSAVEFYPHEYLFGEWWSSGNNHMEVSVNSYFPSANASVASTATSHASAASLNASICEGNSSECASREAGRFWLWFNFILYGWIMVLMWSSLKRSYRRWYAFFDPRCMEDQKPEPYTTVEYLHRVLDTLLELFGFSCNEKRLWIMDVIVIANASRCIGSPNGLLFTALALGVGMILWRICFKRERIFDPLRRFDEVQERKIYATYLNIHLWFLTYITEVVLCSLILPILGGIVVHFAASPFLISFPGSFHALVEELSPSRLVLYWIIGCVCSMMLMHVESTIVSSLFAPGVDLFLVRSGSMDFVNPYYWNIILTHVFDADPLSVFLEFVRMGAIELTTLYLFLVAPLRLVFFIHDAIMRWSLEHRDIPLPLPAGFSFSTIFEDGSAEVFHTLKSGIEKHLAWNSTLGPLPIPSVVLDFLFSFNGVIVDNIWNILHPIWIRAGCNVLIVLGSGTIIAFLILFPVQWMLLRVLRPFSWWVARHIHLEKFLFDEERVLILDEWLRSNGMDEIPIAEVGPTTMFLQREQALPPGVVLPKYMTIRLIVFAALFFVVLCALVWTGPVVTMTLLLNFIPYGVPLVCASLNLFFFALNPKTYLEALSCVFAFCILLVHVLIQPIVYFAWVLGVPRRELVRETMEFRYNIKRAVGVYGVKPDDCVD